MSGYPARGNPILGKVRGFDESKSSAVGLRRDASGRSYTTLGYANGPGHVGASADQSAGSKRFPHEPSQYSDVAVQRPDLDEIETSDPDYLQESTMPLKDETHSGEDVAVYARGPGAEGVHGSLEQNVLFHLLVQANPPMRSRLCAWINCRDRSLPDIMPTPAMPGHQ